MLSAAKEIKKLLKKLGIKDIKEELLNEALTHPSFNFEKNAENAPDYERLEFLGDSVLRLCMSEYLFDKYPDYNEGKLTKIRSYLVSDEYLAKIAVVLNLGSCLNIGIHEEKDGGREKESILACSLEAVFGAVYKSSGFESIKEIIYNLYRSSDEDIDNILLSYNSKEILQQYTQSLNRDLPEYKIIKESGPAHKKIYEIAVFYHNNEIGRGKAKTKKEAEKIAALDAINKLNIKEENQNE